MLQKLFCMRLNTAGIVLGLLGVVRSSFALLMLSFALGKYSDDISQNISENLNTSNEETPNNPIVVYSILLAFAVINLLSSGLLIWGTMKERHLFLLPWLISFAIENVSTFTYSLSSFLAVSDVITPDFIIPFLIKLVYQIYVYYGIYSLYKQIQRTRSQDDPLAAQRQEVSVQNKSDSSYAKM